MKVTSNSRRGKSSFNRRSRRSLAALLPLALFALLTTPLWAKKSAAQSAGQQPSAPAMIRGVAALLPGEWSGGGWLLSQIALAFFSGTSNSLTTAPAAKEPTAASVLPSAGQTAFDFDGDGKADMGIWTPSNGTWQIYQTGTGFVTKQWGANGDRIVPADYDGDGKTDYAVWTPSGGLWSIWKSASQTTYQLQWGAAGDIPVPGDYDGDGDADIAVWRPSTGMWYINKSTSGMYAVQFGNPSVSDPAVDDIPVPGDYDGDGLTDIAVWRASTGTWYINQSTNGTLAWQQWGQAGDIPVPGDYLGSGKTDYAVWRVSFETRQYAPADWYILSYKSSWTMQFGSSSPPDVLIPADYDGDGVTDYAVWRPSTGEWFVQYSNTNSFNAPPPTNFGTTCDVPVAAVYINQSFGPGPCSTPSPTPTPTPTITPTPTPTATQTATPTPNVPPTPQLSKEYIYAGSKMLAVEDANAP